MDKHGMKIKDAVNGGIGIYSLSEAATYARMSKQTLGYWIFGDKGHEPLRPPKISQNEGKFLTFFDFIEALAIHDLRRGLADYIGTGKASLQKIREAVKVAKQKYDIDYPFAHGKHKTYLIGKDIHILLDGDKDLTQLTGKTEGQMGSRTCLELYMKNMVWEKDKPVAYIPYRYSGNKNIEIRLDPNLKFGAPLVGKTGYTAETLWRAANDEGDVEKAAKNYGVDKNSIEAACEYWQSLNAAA